MEGANSIETQLTEAAADSKDPRRTNVSHCKIRKEIFRGI